MVDKCVSLLCHSYMQETGEEPVMNNQICKALRKNGQELSPIVTIEQYKSFLREFAFPNQPEWHLPDKVLTSLTTLLDYQADVSIIMSNI